MHELTHQAIFDEYHIDSEIHMFSKKFPFLKAYTMPEEDCPNEFCSMAHNFNEVVSYNLDAVYWMIFLGLLFIMIIFERRGKE